MQPERQTCGVSQLHPRLIDDSQAAWFRSNNINLQTYRLGNPWQDEVLVSTAGLDEALSVIHLTEIPFIGTSKIKINNLILSSAYDCHRKAIHFYSLDFWKVYTSRIINNLIKSVKKKERKKKKTLEGCLSLLLTAYG